MGIKFVFVNLRAYNLLLTIFFVLVLSFMKLVGSIFYKSEKIIIASNYLITKVKYRNKLILTNNPIFIAHEFFLHIIQNIYVNFLVSSDSKGR